MTHKIIPIILAFSLFSGCASHPNVRERHQSNLDMLDQMYKNGSLDAVQYQVKYAEEVQNYNSKKIAIASYLSGRR